MSLEHLNTDLASWEIGPFHVSLPAPMRLKIQLDGEIIVSAHVETGFLHRGLEKAIERHLWQSAITYADRLDPEASVFGELVLCLAVEEIARLAVPPRARGIRVILCELGRISAHMGYIVRIARAVGAETMLHYVLRDREKVLDLFELVAGARFTLNFIQYGGVREDVTEGFIERVLEFCELVRIRLKEYNDLLTFNHAFVARTRGVGRLNRKAVKTLGITGPNARSAGVAIDIRKLYPYSGYDQIDFAVTLNPTATENSGDVHDRFIERLREISQSAEILKQVSESLGKGPFRSQEFEKDFAPPPGEAYVRVESSRGLLGCYVLSDGGRAPVRVQFRPPTYGSLAAVSSAIAGMRLEDLPVFLASLDLGIAEADR